MREDFKLLTKELTLELETQQQYDRGDLALTSNQLTDLYSRVRDLTKRRLAACPHACVQGVRESDYHTDEYGSGHTTYYVRLKCNDCDQTLLEKFTGDNYRYNWSNKTKPTTLKEGCIWWDQQPGAYSSHNAKKIEDYGVRRVERRVVEYV
jgi:hypothetical protein